MLNLAKQIVVDGEGQKILTISVINANHWKCEKNCILYR